MSWRTDWDESDQLVCDECFREFDRFDKVLTGLSVGANGQLRDEELHFHIYCVGAGRSNGY